MRCWAVYIAFAVTNASIVAGVNIAYVYAALYADSYPFAIVQVAMSVFKLVWNGFFSLRLTRMTDHYLHSVLMTKGRSVTFFGVQLFVSLFNFIALPCIIVAAISPDCFANIAVAQPAVTSYFFYETCEVSTAHFGCLAYAPVSASTTYDPPFTYGYQCSSSLITFYAPTFVYMGLFTTFGTPLLDVLLHRMHSTAKQGTARAAFLNKHVHPLLRDVTVESAAADPPYSLSISPISTLTTCW